MQELYLAGRKQEAIDAIPDEYVDEAGLYGSIKRIEQRWPAWADSGLTGFTVVTNQEEAIQLMADLTGLTSAPGRPKLGGSRPELP